MRAIVYDRYGPPDVLHLEDVEQPLPGADEVLVRVRATAVTRLDCATRDANRRSGLATSVLSRLVSGVRAPRQRILGSELASDVAAVGGAVTEFAVGDTVICSTGLAFGGYAEYVSLRERDRIVRKPASLSYPQAASLSDGGLNALWCLRPAELRTGTRVLVYGASGAIGTAGLQLAKAFGAEVTAVTSSRNVALVTSLGADAVIDYTREDFTQNGRRYDVILDAVGKLSFRRCRGSLSAHGMYLATDGFANVLLNLVTPYTGGRRVFFSLPPRYTKQDLAFLVDLVESGKFRPVVDRVYPFDQVVEATRYVESEHKVGNVILAVDGDDGGDRAVDEFERLVTGWPRAVR
jgi:NADPH:quinone reductase-like Zn-dependent oxidoreductase